MRLNTTPWIVVTLLLAALLACSLPERNPTDLAATETAAAATVSAIGVKPTVIRATQPAAITATVPPIAQPTASQPPASATAAVSAAPAATNTPPATATMTPLPALPLITDVCALLDLSQLNSFAGDTFAKKQQYAQTNSYTDCVAVGAHGTYATLGVAQATIAENLLLSDYAAIEGSTGCDWSKLKPAGPDKTAQARARLAALYAPELLTAGVLGETLKLADSKGCADLAGWRLLPKVKEIALADHAFYNIEELRVVNRQALLGFTITKTGVTNDVELTLEETWAAQVTLELNHP